MLSDRVVKSKHKNKVKLATINGHKVDTRNLMNSDLYSPLLVGLDVVNHDKLMSEESSTVTVVGDKLVPDNEVVKDSDNNKDDCLPLPWPDSLPVTTMEDYLLFLNRHDVDNIKTCLKACSLLGDPVYLQHCVNRFLLNYDNCKDVLEELSPCLLEQVYKLMPKDLLPETLQDSDDYMKSWIWPHYIRLLDNKGKDVELSYRVNNYTYDYKCSLSEDGNICMFCKVDKHGIKYRFVKWWPPLRKAQVSASNNGVVNDNVNISNHYNFKLIKMEENYNVSANNYSGCTLRLYTTYYDNGVLEHRKPFNEQGCSEGLETEYTRQGNVLSTTELKDGYRHGQTTTWYENTQQVQRISWYNMGQRERYVCYHKNGSLDRKVLEGQTEQLYFYCTVNCEGVIKQPLESVEFLNAKDDNAIVKIDYYTSWVVVGKQHEYQTVQSIVRRTASGGTATASYTEAECMYVICDLL